MSAGEANLDAMSEMVEKDSAAKARISPPPGVAGAAGAAGAGAAGGVVQGSLEHMPHDRSKAWKESRPVATPWPPNERSQRM